MELEGRHAFSSPVIQTKTLKPWVLESQMGRQHDKIRTDPDAGLHILRPTFLTEAGGYGRFYAVVRRRARHYQDRDAVCAPSGGVSQLGGRPDQSDEKSGAVGVATDAKGANENAYRRPV